MGPLTPVTGGAPVAPEGAIRFGAVAGEGPLTAPATGAVRCVSVVLEAPDAGAGATPSSSSVMGEVAFAAPFAPEGAAPPFTPVAGGAPFAPEAAGAAWPPGAAGAVAPVAPPAGAARLKFGGFEPGSPSPKT